MVPSIKTSRINNHHIGRYVNTYLANSNEFAVRSWQTADIFLWPSKKKNIKT